MPPGKVTIFERAAIAALLDTKSMDSATAERRLGQFLPRFCFASLLALGLAFFFGGLSGRSTDYEPPLLQNFTRQFFTFYIIVVPLIFIFFLLYISYLGGRESRQKASGANKLLYEDAFDLPSQIMHGYKIAFVTGQIPTITGLTGDLYSADDTAKCEMNPDHVPPVADCDCGFYAYSDIRDAKHQLSINPISFLMDVDLFGIGFVHSRGFRAETQVVNSLTMPNRCMRCKILRPIRFVKSYKFSFNSYAYWRWEFRCQICSLNFKEKDCLSTEQMSQALGVTIIR